MRTSLLAVSFLLTVAATGCKSTWCEACDGSQAVVDRVARENPEVTRLTVHCTPPQGGTPMACASTAADKRGQPSDPEDLRAMQTGETIVLEEADALDVTVPIMNKDGRFLGACGVTLKPEGLNRQQAIEKAKGIAMAVEGGVKNCGACTCDCCGNAK